MKRLLPTALLLAAILILEILSNRSVNKICASAEKQLAIYSELSSNGDYTKAKEKANEINKYWEKKSRLLSLYVNHGYIDEIALNLNRLAAPLTPDNTEQAESALADTKYLLGQILNEQRFSIESFY